MTVALEDGTRALLVELAGGERKIGAYLSVLVRDVHSGRLVPVEQAQAMLRQAEAVLAEYERARGDVERRLDALEQTMKERGVWEEVIRQ